VSGPADRVCVVSGGASGIGLGVAKRFKEAGHPVAIFDVQAELVAQAAAELGVLGLVADVGDRAAVDRAIEQIRAELGPITIMITSAGINAEGKITEITQDEWERAIRINLTGTFNCIQPVVPDMIEAGWGRIVTISSMAGQVAAPERPHYAASKAGVIGLTRALSADLAPLGITVNTIPPSIVHTPMAEAGIGAAGIEAMASMVPVRRVSYPEDIAAACEFLCSDDAGFITGQQINVNGGMYV
jgi:NAD(P)-dependent dehydrogenase (short-subunit alcohol dehydrogenase family)